MKVRSVLTSPGFRACDPFRVAKARRALLPLWIRGAALISLICLVLPPLFLLLGLIGSGTGQIHVGWLGVVHDGPFHHPLPIAFLAVYIAYGVTGFALWHGANYGVWLAIIVAAGTFLAAAAFTVLSVGDRIPIEALLAAPLLVQLYSRRLSWSRAVHVPESCSTAHWGQPDPESFGGATWLASHARR